MRDENELAIYQAADGAIELPIDAKSETIWASQKQNRRQKQNVELVLLMLKVDNRR